MNELQLNDVTAWITQLPSSFI